MSDHSEKNQRIDKLLAELYPDESRAYWKNRIENGFVFVNEKKIKPTYKVKLKDEIKILPESEMEKPVNAIETKKIPEIDIIYEDDMVIILDKPAGLPVHGAPSFQGPTVVDFLLNHFPAIKNVGDDPARPGIVHRLDKDTSGVMVAAKTNESFEFLKNQFKNRHAQKTYLTLVHGNVQDESGVIDLKIGRSKTNPKMQTVIDTKKKEGIKSREAVTVYNVKKRFGDFTLLEVVPKTGRMHQIRVHLKARGFPVAGDKKYFLRKFSKIELKPARQFLHASSLEIELPSGRRKKFESKLPKDLSEFLNKLSF